MIWYRFNHLNSLGSFSEVAMNATQFPNSFQSSDSPFGGVKLMTGLVIRIIYRAITVEVPGLLFFASGACLIRLCLLSCKDVCNANRGNGYLFLQ